MDTPPMVTYISHTNTHAHTTFCQANLHASNDASLVLTAVVLFLTPVLLSPRKRTKGHVRFDRLATSVETHPASVKRLHTSGRPTGAGANSVAQVPHPILTTIEHHKSLLPLLGQLLIIICVVVEAEFHLT